MRLVDVGLGLGLDRVMASHGMASHGESFSTCDGFSTISDCFYAHWYFFPYLQ
jgi:hypothetical protein